MDLGLIEHVLSIQCYTCSELDFHCPLPLNLDGGDESNENAIDTFNYDSDFACLVNSIKKWRKKTTISIPTSLPLFQSDHSMNPQNGEEKLILRGIQNCQELNIPNRRIHCCYSNNCNKQLPPMTIQTLADSLRSAGSIVESSSPQYFPSICVIVFSILFLCVSVATCWVFMLFVVVVETNELFNYNKYQCCRGLQIPVAFLFSSIEITNSLLKFSLSSHAFLLSFF